MLVVAYKNSEKKGKGEKDLKYTKKTKDRLWACFNKAKPSFVAFVKNESDDEDDNHILNGSKLSVTLSENTRCHGLTIFENEAVIKFSPLAFYSKIPYTLGYLLAKKLTSKTQN